MSHPTVLRSLRSEHARAYIDLCDATEALNKSSLWAERAAIRYEMLCGKLAVQLSVREDQIRLREPVKIEMVEAV